MGQELFRDCQLKPNAIGRKLHVEACQLRVTGAWRCRSGWYVAMSWGGSASCCDGYGAEQQRGSGSSGKRRRYAGGGVAGSREAMGCETTTRTQHDQNTGPLGFRPGRRVPGERPVKLVRGAGRSLGTRRS